MPLACFNGNQQFPTPNNASPKHFQRISQHAEGMSLRYDSDFALFTAFSSVALLTEHLAIFFGGSTSIAPWSDMVALHKYEV